MLNPERRPERKRLPVSVSTAVLVEDKQGRLLFVQQEAEWKGQKWGPPAGGMEAFETPAETALAFVFRARLKDENLVLKNGEIKEARLYKPEYNLPGIQDWLAKVSYSLEVIR